MALEASSREREYHRRHGRGLHIQGWCGEWNQVREMQFFVSYLFRCHSGRGQIKQLQREEEMARKMFGYLLVFSLLSSMTGGCVMSPINDSQVCTSPNVTVWGYTDSASATVTFYGWNFDTEDWDSVGSTTSGSTGYEFCPEGDMYYFTGSAYMPLISDYTDGNGWRGIMVHGGSWYLTTFDSGGSNCMSYRVTELEETCAEAAEVCASEDSPEIWINCPTK